MLAPLIVPVPLKPRPGWFQAIPARSLTATYSPEAFRFALNDEKYEPLTPVQEAMIVAVAVSPIAIEVLSKVSSTTRSVEMFWAEATVARPATASRAMLF